MDRRTGFQMIAALALALPSGVSAQEGSRGAERRPASLVGQVVNAATGRPVDGALVSLIVSGAGAFTDSTGSFRIPSAFAVTDTIEVRSIGYEPSRTSVELVPERTSRITLLLSATAVRVADLTVEVRGGPRSPKLVGFLERRQMGFGVFFTPRQIRERAPRIPSDLLRGVAGVSVGPERNGRAPVFLGRGAGMGCRPAIFVDGALLAGLEIDDIPKEDLGAVEIYKGPADTPPQFILAGSSCGAIVIWTPDGPEFFEEWVPGG